MLPLFVHALPEVSVGQLELGSFAQPGTWHLQHHFNAADLGTVGKKPAPDNFKAAMASITGATGTGQNVGCWENPMKTPWISWELPKVMCPHQHPMSVQVIQVASNGSSYHHAIFMLDMSKPLFMSYIYIYICHIYIYIFEVYLYIYIYCIGMQESFCIQLEKQIYSRIPSKWFWRHLPDRGMEYWFKWILSQRRFFKFLCSKFVSMKMREDAWVLAFLHGVNPNDLMCIRYYQITPDEFTTFGPKNSLVLAHIIYGYIHVHNHIINHIINHIKAI